MSHDATRVRCTPAIMNPKSGCLLSLFGSGNPYVVGRQDFRIREFGLHFYSLESRLLLRHRLEYDVVLVTEHLLKIVQVRLKTDQLRSSEREDFPAGFLRDFRKP